MPDYTLEESVTYLLKATAGITTHVSTRIYPDLAADNATLPYIVWRVDDENEEQTFATPSGNPRRLSATFSCYADRSSTGTKKARDTAEAVRTALLNYTGTPIAGGRTILAVTEISMGSGMESDSGYDDQRVGRELRVVLWYR